MIRILIADDHAVVRRGLKQIVEDEPDMRVVGEAGTAREILPLLRQQKGDVLVLDLNMPDRSGLEVLADVKSAHPHLPVLVLSVQPEDQYALRVLRAGAAGYLTKDAAPEELVKALRKVCTGHKYVSASLAEQLASALVEGGGKPLHEALTDREFQVLCLMAAGKSMGAIADELAVSIKTVSTYRTRMLAKMKMKTNAELIAYAIRQGLVK